MRCAWNNLLALVPPWLQQSVDEQGREHLQELRLRIGRNPELVLENQRTFYQRIVQPEDIKYCINAVSRYSPWTTSTTAKGYITSIGGHRVGLCGEAVVKNGKMTGIKTATSVCIRVARDFPQIAAAAAKPGENILIIGKPGSGKTTFLRDLIRQRSGMGETIAVVDERMEIFPEEFFDPGIQTDVLSGCPKPEGIDTVLRTMGPECIAVDEITEESDCESLIRCAWCGVHLIATAHASSKKDLTSRSVYQPLIKSNLFDKVIVLQPDKTWRLERIGYGY